MEVSFQENINTRWLGKFWVDAFEHLSLGVLETNLTKENN